MSDTEAGECEAAENPEPEDDAHLSCTQNTQASATDSEALQRQSGSNASDVDCISHASPQPTCDDGDRNQTHQVDAGQVVASDSGLPECTKIHANGVASRQEDGVETGAVEAQLDQQEWPPEAERGAGETGSEGRDTGVSRAASELAGEMGEEQKTAANAESAGVEQSSNFINEHHPARVTADARTEESDREESPPEAEGFAVSGAGTAACEADKEEDSGSGCADSVHKTDGSLESHLDVSSINAVAEAEFSSLLRQSEEDNVEEESSVSSVQLPASQDVTSSTTERDADQIPECDREPSPKCPPHASGGSAPDSCPHDSHDSAADPSLCRSGDMAPDTCPHGSGDTAPDSCLHVNSKSPPDSLHVSGESPPDTLLVSGDTALDSCPPGSGDSALDSSDSAVSSSPVQSPDSSPVQTTVCDQGSSSQTCQSQTNAPCESVHKPTEGSCDNSSDCDSAASSQMSAQLVRTSGPHGSGERDLLMGPSYVGDDSEDEDLLTELDAELHLRCSPRRQQADASNGPVRLPLNGLKDMDPKNSELCKQFEEQLLQLQETVLQREREISRLKDEKGRQREVSQGVIAERDKLKAELAAVTDKNPDDLYLPQIKELEYTISQQQSEVRQLKEKLTSHDSAAKRAIATLQSEMKARIDQITKLYEDSCREKDLMVVKFAESETKNIGAKCAEEKLESRVRDLLKEKEFTTNKMRAAMAEKQKAVADVKTKIAETTALQKELERMKEEMSSTDYRIKWHQNKLKAELDAHKETKANLEKMTAKLKEAKEETEMIRRDCQAIVKTYQESEEVRSNSLDKELKMKETELMIKMKEKSDTEEIHLQTKKELDALKAHHKDALEELKTLKDKVQCLEEERLQGEQVQSKYQTIIQNQKSDNAGLSRQLNELRTLQEDFDRAQEMIKTLDSEVKELKLTNRDLQKDIEGCQARESKMLTLQSELSRTNALLRSENTNLNNQVVNLSGDVQTMKMDIQDLETRSKNLADQLEEEQKNRKEETETLSSQLAAKTKESDDFRQKWEDEIDASKTWKRKHNNNVKDLTRQLQHAKKRLESYENGSGDRDGTSMGSRTNSNGSLNSMDNSSNQQAAHHQGQANSQPANVQHSRPSQEPEFPVITEQVEVDRQLLIERIVRLQRSLARKNEKLDFLEEHIQQLVTEIKKKNRILQGYVMREEAGTLASDVMDANKLAVRKEAQALLARKGGIMASVYSQHQQDGHMTLDLSLEINKKLQAVLEDTLLKNMTLKENLDTLGAEIARLSQENRRLQLHLQGLGAH